MKGARATVLALKAKKNNNKNPKGQMLGVVDPGDKTQIDTPHWLRATPKISRQMTASSAVQKRPIILTQLQKANESSPFLGQILGSHSFHLSGSKSRSTTARTAGLKDVETTVPPAAMLA